jgi:hypothetical protein
MTASFDGLIGALLTCLSFELQIEANMIQHNTLRHEILQDQAKSGYETLDKHQPGSTLNSIN